MAVPNLVDLRTLIEQYKIRINENIKGIINYNTKRLDSIRESYILKNPLALYEVKEQKLDTYIDRLNGFMSTMLNEYKNRLDNIKSSYVLKNPLATYEVKKERIANLENILNKIIINKIDVSKHKYEVMINKLELLNPLNILSKGYSLVTIDGMVVKDTEKLKVEDTINIRMHKGNVKAIVKEID